MVLFPEKTLWRSIGGVEGVLCCCRGTSVSVAVLIVCRDQLEKRSCRYVTDKLFCVASYQVLDVLLAADC